MAGILAIGLGGCASPGPARPTQDLYEEAVEISGYGFRCSARDSVRFDERLRPLLPWLEAELGKENVDRVRSGMAESLSTTDFINCPTRGERFRSRAAADRLLERLEARSKR